MPQVGFEPMIPQFGRAKTVQALDHVATEISWQKASTTEKWASVVNEVKVLTGLYSQGVSKKVRILFLTV
jgi:hypothetical protein